MGRKGPARKGDKPGWRVAFDGSLSNCQNIQFEQYLLRLVPPQEATRTIVWQLGVASRSGPLSSYFGSMSTTCIVLLLASSFPVSLT